MAVITNTKSYFYLFTTVFSTLLIASHCDGADTKIIYNILYPPQLGLSNQASCQCSTKENWYLIRNPKSDCALEPRFDRRVTLQEITENDEQLWKFEPVGKPGVYYIINKGSGEVLQAPEEKYNGVLMGRKSDIPEQHWLVDTHGRLYSVALDGNLDVKGAVFEVGTPLQVVNNNGNAAQVFWLHQTKGN